MQGIIRMIFIAITAIGASNMAFALKYSAPPIMGTEADGTHNETPLQLADKRDYRHCHYVFTRSYCHRRDSLPVNWPPFSDRDKNKG
ncbi:hypothetical protein [Hyphomicrobium sp. 99]|uniref:hypothetical protein n=1 Tax=Hyphomicrobium sp. 99 TaxID=1163419 RepID=UPI0012E0A242|nr:hypothetical protein [Hyphomicrobium sp. 99]